MKILIIPIDFCVNSMCNDESQLSMLADFNKIREAILQSIGASIQKVNYFN